MRAAATTSLLFLIGLLLPQLGISSMQPRVACHRKTSGCSHGGYKSAHRSARGGHDIPKQWALLRPGVVRELLEEREEQAVGREGSSAKHVPLHYLRQVVPHQLPVSDVSALQRTARNPFVHRLRHHDVPSVSKQIKGRGLARADVTPTPDTPATPDISDTPDISGDVAWFGILGYWVGYRVESIMCFANSLATRGDGAGMAGTTQH